MSQHSSPADLYVVATPIGNLADMSYRAVEVLSSVDLVAAEDTRHTRELFEHYGITTPLIALHEHNENTVAPQLLNRLLEGKPLALVTDAGTPLLSDPGYRLLNLAIGAHITVRAIPGASAVTAALSVAGLATDRFAFEGFLPSKQPARIACLHKLRGEQRTLVFFESSHRIVASIGDMAQVFGEQRAAAVCRELTKRFETVLRAGLGSLHQTIAHDADQQKGEFVIVVAGAKPDQSVAMAKAVEMGHALQEFLSLSQAARVAARLCAVERRELYQKLSGEE
jgi:16S rRNA (cytidine1402-2'-O)-methyltransferase